MYVHNRCKRLLGQPLFREELGSPSRSHGSCAEDSFDNCKQATGGKGTNLPRSIQSSIDNSQSSVCSCKPKTHSAAPIIDLTLNVSRSNARIMDQHSRS